MKDRVNMLFFPTGNGHTGGIISQRLIYFSSTTNETNLDVIVDSL